MKRKKRYYFILTLAVLFTVFVGILFLNKIIKINPAFADRYELHGVDVSHYQGTIDWEKLAGQKVDFAFIKATEGSSHLDECFYDNWQAAGKTDLYIGAYHFFSFDSEGKKQAEFFMDTVGDLDEKLPPVIDVEFYGNKAADPPKKEEVVTQLGEMLSVLEEHYQVKPIIYTTYTVYNKYMKGEFQEYPLWIRNVYYPPDVTMNGAWSFWQYTDTAVLEGYEGTEKYIDLNVFRGTKEELEMLLIHKEESEAFRAQNDADHTMQEISPDVPEKSRGESRSREEVFEAVENGDFSVVIAKDGDPDRLVEGLEDSYEMYINWDVTSTRFERCDINEDGLEELVFFIQYDFEDHEQIEFILEYRNGSAICTYYDWCDGNECLILGDQEKLIHCLYSDNGFCSYSGYYECTLNTKGIKDLDYTGCGLEICNVYSLEENGLWWWTEQLPEITKEGIYYVRVRAETDEEMNRDGSVGGLIKELITQEEFLEEYKELTGKEFIE